jgi:chromate transporter
MMSEVPGSDSTKQALAGAQRPTAWALFRICLSIGLFSFGGGLTGWIHREIVVRRRWMTEADFLNGVSLGQVLPGANVTNLVVYVGQRLLGPMGAIVGLVGLIAGPFLAVIALVSVYESMTDLAWLSRALNGAAAAAIGLLLVVGVAGMRRAARAWTSGLVLAATVVAIGVMQWPLLPVVAGLGSVSIALAWARIRA